MFSLSRFSTLPAAMLLSIVNTQLRDHFDSLEELCAYHDICSKELIHYLSEAHYHYDAAQAQFKQE